MKSKASSFSLSIPLIKENLRRFWAIPAISFLIYFLSGVFPILMAYGKINTVAEYINMSLQNLQPFFMGAHLLIPVISAVVLFRYLQSPGSVAVMHSLPFTRAGLFNSNFLSGAFMTTVPILLSGSILLLMAKPAYRNWGYGPEMSLDKVDVFTRAGVLNWIGTSLLIVLVLYSVSVFAGIVTGNTFMHLMASFFFAGLLTVLYAVFYVYFQEFLFGFSASQQWWDICLSISPYTGVLNGQGHFGTVAVLYYVATILLMYGVSAFLYRGRKLERATDALVFGFMKPVICYVIAFLGMTLLGFYFEILGESRLYMYTGFVAGTLIFFIIGQMIVTKTTRIFNKEGLVSFLIYGLIAAVFVVGLNVDATGFERRVPRPEKVSSVSVSDPFNNYGGYRYQPLSGSDLHSPENIRALTAFHQSVLDNRDRFENPDQNVYSNPISLRYNMKGLLDLERSYTIDYEFFAGNADLAKVYESLEYKSLLSLYGRGAETFVSITINPGYYMESTPVFKNKNEIDELIACMEKDLRAKSFEDMFSLKHKYAVAEINFITLEDAARGNRNPNGYLSFPISRVSTNTIQWLEDHGYDFSIKPEQIEYIDVFPATDGDPFYSEEYPKETASGTSSGSTIPPLLRITDKTAIQTILDRYDDQLVRYDSGYRIEIKYHHQADGYGQEYEFLSGYLNEEIDFLK